MPKSHVLRPPASRPKTSHLIRSHLHCSQPLVHARHNELRPDKLRPDCVADLQKLDPSDGANKSVIPPENPSKPRLVFASGWGGKYANTSLLLNGKRADSAQSAYVACHISIPSCWEVPVKWIFHRMLHSCNNQLCTVWILLLAGIY